jgi:UDP-N-acetylglucosamine--N-acetylmuramyl-(pentapeptide) pyrophosphoryl-undecaprenol N-acetylglucosamine transferase
MKTIAVTGGHHNSALVVAQALMKNDVKVIWLGHRHASRADHNDSAEYTEVTASGIKFYDLAAGRGSLSISELWRIPLGFFHARSILQKIRPQALLTFGSYLGVAGALAAATLGIPVYLHEQTVVAGRANKLIGSLAKKIYLTWESSLKYFPKTKSQVVGLPIREKLLSAKKTQLFPNSLPSLLILGGKQGSHVINECVSRSLPELLTKYNVVHQTGTTSETGDYDRGVALANTISGHGCYEVHGYIGEQELAKYLSSVKLVIGRSGAHITYELGILGVPAVLIPYLHTHDHEQHQNASYLADRGLAVILPESDLSTPHLLESIDKVMDLKPSRLVLPEQAAQIMVKDILYG